MRWQTCAHPGRRASSSPSDLLTAVARSTKRQPPHITHRDRILATSNIDLVVAMLCPILVSRGAELHALSAALRRAREGAGGVLILAGDAGVGKSRLAREVSAQAASQGFDVLAGRATESIVPGAFRPITEALMKLARAGVSPHAPGRGGDPPALGSRVPQWSVAEDGARGT